MADPRHPSANRYGRREFLQAGAAAASLWMAPGSLTAAESPAAEPTAAEPTAAGGPPLAFTADGSQYAFATGPLHGTLRGQGRTRGLMPLVDADSNKAVASGYGVFSHYRLLDSQTRYGGGAWDWASRARRQDDGSVAVAWSADDLHPFDMAAVYRWSAPQVLDLTTTVTATRDLQRMEVFLASYFDGFPQSCVYVAETGEQPAFVEAVQEAGVWQMFPRDAAAVEIIQDGRWRRPPSPVDWQIRTPLAAPLALRRDPDSGLAALIMAPAEDCFAVATPYGQEGHRSLYLSLLGRDLAAGQTATARARLVVQHGLSDEEAVSLYRDFTA